MSLANSKQFDTVDNLYLVKVFMQFILAVSVVLVATLEHKINKTKTLWAVK